MPYREFLTSEPIPHDLMVDIERLERLANGKSPYSPYERGARIGKKLINFIDVCGVAWYGLYLKPESEDDITGD